MTTFQSLKELAKKAYSTYKYEIEGLRELKIYVDKYINYFKCIYPEIINDLSPCYQYLEMFDKEEDFIRYIIDKYDISPLKLFNLDRDVMINTYIESKTHKNMENLIENQIIYLAILPKHLMNELSLNDWNKIIESYENDKNALVEPYDSELDGQCFITTNLYNILKNHSLLDLRFNVGYRTIYHKTDFISLNY